MTQEAPWSRIVLAFVWTTAYLRVPNRRLLILWTLLRSHRGLLVPTNKANDISRAMRLAWCTMCPHHPPLSPEFSKASRLLVLYPYGEASIWKGWEYRDFNRYMLLLSFASLATKGRLGQRPTLYIIIQLLLKCASKDFAYLVAGKFYGISSLKSSISFWVSSVDETG